MAGLGLGMVCGLLFLFGRLAAPVIAAPLNIPLSCTISSPTTLTPAGSPYTVNCPVDVQAPLTIQPGVVVSFTSVGQLVVQPSGQLVAIGTPTQPITFTASPGTCAWLGVDLLSDNNIVEYATFEYARYAVKVEVGSDFNTINFNRFQNNGGCLSNPLSGAVVGSTDNSAINDNAFINNNTAIYLSKSSNNTIARNLISKTTQVGLSFFPPAATRSSNNVVVSNTIRNAGGFGIYMAVGDNNSILDNKVFSNTAGGIRLEDQNATIGKRVTIRNNDVYGNSSGFGIYITDTTGLDLGENLVLNNGQGVLWDLNNDPGSAVITRNVICRNPIYLFRNNAAASITAARNWWGTNNPGIGTQIQGPVTITPYMVLSAAAGNPSLPANGISTTTLTVSLQGGGETVPLRARAITLTTSLGTISPSLVTLNNSGIATATYTSAITPGAVGIIATDICTSTLLTSTLALTPVYNLAVTKTTALTWAVPGQVVTYTIRYSNTSNYPASGVVISDALPAFGTFVGDNSGLSRSGSGGGPISWTVGTLPAHTGNTFVLTASISSTATCNNPITNTAFIGGAGGEPNLGDNSSSASRQILCGANLVVVKNDGVGINDPRLNAAAGEYITYTISVNNMGNQLATNVILNDILPAHTIFNAARSTSGWTLAGGGVYTINLGNLVGNGGGTVIYFVAQVDPNLSCAITQTVNTATASSNGPEIYPPDNTSNEQTPIVCGPTTLQLSKEDFVPCAMPGQLIDYAITVTNSGTASANNLTLTEFLPTNTSFQGPASAWTPAGGSTYTHNIGTLNGGQINTTGFWVQVATSTTASAITNVVTLQPSGLNFVLTTPISTSAPDLYILKNDNIELLSTTTAASIARLEQKLGPLPWLEAVKGQGLGSQAIAAKPGDVISYTIAFGNAGTSPAANVVISETLPVNTTFLGPAYWTAVNANTYVYTISNLLPGSGGNLDFRVRVANPFPTGTPGVTNTVQIAGTGLSECDTSNNISREFTRIDETVVGSITVYLPLIFKSSQTSPPPIPTPIPTPTPLAYVSDVKADPDTNQVFVASPRHDWVYVINGSNDSLARNVPVGHGPTGLTVLDGSAPANNKVFVAHQYGANQWHPGFMAFGVNDTAAHVTDDGGYAGAAPIKTAANAANNSRVYVSNYFDKLAVFNGNSGPPEVRVGWVVQKAFQGAYGIETSSATNRVYLATRDTGELVVFDGNGDRLLQSNYIPTHVKPPQACSLWSVAVNETTGHVFVPCPQLSKVFVLQESQVSVLALEALGTLEERDGFLALVVSPQVAPWLTDLSIPNGTNLGEEGIAVDISTGRVFITNGQNNSLVILQDGATPAYVTTVAVGTKPQGVDVNPATQKVYVGNTGSNSVTVLNAASPFSVIKTIQLTP
jgi:uncharacterized repeat protein (TIGR01451 family)